MVSNEDANKPGSHLSSGSTSSKVVALRIRVQYHLLKVLFVLGTLFVWLHIPYASLSFLQPVRQSTDPDHREAFYWKLRTHGLEDESDSLCEGMYTESGNKAISHSGYIGLNGDSEDTPKRSFFWFFEAQDGNKSAPVILTMGGGPGVSGLLNTLLGQSHCKLTRNATVEPNPYAWTERFNLIALDHPVNVGFSYGTRVHNSREAAHDVYDFLQKFYVLFPHLVGNPLILSGGSYGGTYIPHMATVIHQSNLALASSPRHLTRSSNVPINLNSMMLSNPHTDALSHYTWSLHYRCTLTDLYNSTVCSNLYPRLPACLDAIRLVYQDPDVLKRRVRANELCQETQLQKLDGRAYENVNVRCNGTLADCLPEVEWLSAFLNSPNTKERLGVPDHLNFSSVNQKVHRDFIEAGDIVQPAQLMYPPLLEDGVRLLHYVGKLDANCPWPGTLSMLNLLQTPLQAAFLATPDLPWTGENATVRVVHRTGGAAAGAGQLTYVTIEDSGHMVVKDQPALAKKIVERWVLDWPFHTVDSKVGMVKEKEHEGHGIDHVAFTDYLS